MQYCTAVAGTVVPSDYSSIPKCISWSRATCGRQDNRQTLLNELRKKKRTNDHPSISLKIVAQEVTAYSRHFEKHVIERNARAVANVLMVPIQARLAHSFEDEDNPILCAMHDKES